MNKKWFTLVELLLAIFLLIIWLSSAYMAFWTTNRSISVILDSQRHYELEELIRNIIIKEREQDILSLNWLFWVWVEKYYFILWGWKEWSWTTQKTYNYSIIYNPNELDFRGLTQSYTSPENVSNIVIYHRGTIYKEDSWVYRFVLETKSNQNSKEITSEFLFNTTNLN